MNTIISWSARAWSGMRAVFACLPLYE